MKILCRFGLLLLVFLFCAGIVFPVWGEENTSLAVSKGCVTLDAAVSLHDGVQLLDTAKAVILYELDSQTLIYAWNPDQRVDPSGMNKLMTALLALENGNPDTLVTVTRSALNSVAVGSVSAGLKSGEEITLRDLLYCMMVGSANDAAAVIAEHIGSSQEAFVGMMNQRALELGCENTCFMNANGLSHAEQYSTARDLAKITEAALKNEIFVELFNAVSYTVPATNKCEERKIVTTNYLTSQETVKNQFDSRVTGGKTGALSTTDRSLISTAQSNGRRYLSVVMSAQGTVTANGLSVKTFGSFEETRALLDFGFGNFSVRQVLGQEKILGQFSVNGGENDVVGCPAQNVLTAMPHEIAPEDITYKATVDTDLSAPVKKGQVIGKVEVWYKNICVGQCDMLAGHSVDQPGVNNIPLKPMAQEKDANALFTWLLIGGVAILALALAAGVTLLLMRTIRRSQVKRRHKLINGGS